jgi:hypothetical protein
MTSAFPAQPIRTSKYHHPFNSSSQLNPVLSSSSCKSAGQLASVSELRKVAHLFGRALHWNARLSRGNRPTSDISSTPHRFCTEQPEDMNTVSYSYPFLVPGAQERLHRIIQSCQYTYLVDYMVGSLLHASAQNILPRPRFTFTHRDAYRA